MKKLAYLALSGTTLLLALTACNDKDSDPTPAAATRTSLLTGHNWKVSSATITATGTTISQNIFNKPCELDDFYTFRTDKTVIDDEGATKCDQADPQQETGAWAFSTDEQKLTLTAGGQSLFVVAPDADIKELSATTLHLTATGPVVDPTTGISVPCTVNFVFVPQ